ncbi:MAG: hypothetical protein ACQEQF_07065 [Bacillota bacterium]
MNDNEELCFKCRKIVKIKIKKYKNKKEYYCKECGQLLKIIEYL